MTARITPKAKWSPAARIFVAMVNNGMRRAYRAAEKVAKKYPTHAITITIAPCNNELENADPEFLPAVLFVVDDWRSIKLQLDVTEAEMTCRLLTVVAKAEAEDGDQ